MDASTVSKLTPYARRLLDDEHLQDELRELVADVRRVAARAQRVGPEGAIGDKRLRRHAAGGAAAAVQIYEAFNQPTPPKSHRLRRIAVVAVLGAGAALAYRELIDGRD